MFNSQILVFSPCIPASLSLSAGVEFESTIKKLRARDALILYYNYLILYYNYCKSSILAQLFESKGEYCMFSSSTWLKTYYLVTINLI